MAWTTSDTRYESAGFTATQETSPIDYLMNDDSIPDEQVHLSDDEDTGNDHLPKADMRNDCKGSGQALSISKMKVDRYLDFGLELLVPEDINATLIGTLVTQAARLSELTCVYSVLLEYKPTLATEALDYRVKEYKTQDQKDLPELRMLCWWSKYENKVIVLTEMELELEQTQQGSSHEVSVSTEGVEELKRNVRIKGVKKEALHSLRQKLGQHICCQNHKDGC
ncbi:hypothetical protein Tco_0848208 [Tanacetum coccineum]